MRGSYLVFDQQALGLTVAVIRPRAPVTIFLDGRPATVRQPRAAQTVLQRWDDVCHTIVEGLAMLYTRRGARETNLAIRLAPPDSKPPFARRPPRRSQLSLRQR